jgi:hypothetical protein
VLSANLRHEAVTPSARRRYPKRSLNWDFSIQQPDEGLLSWVFRCSSLSRIFEL